MTIETREHWREAQAKREIGSTDIPRAAAVCLSAAFLAVIVSVPVIQHLRGWREAGAGAPADSLAFYRTFDGVSAAMAADWREAPTFLRHFLDPNATLLGRINSAEETLDETCFLVPLTQPRVQSILCRLGAGNEEAFVGNDGWLFYVPGIHYLTGPGFLSPAQLVTRARAGNEYAAPPQPDPVKAIRHFRDELRAFGVNLLVMPVPVKASIYPDKFSRGYGADTEPLQNVSFAAFKERLRADDILVFDIAESLMAFRDSGRRAYLKTDTHWTWDAMAMTAARLGHLVDHPGIGTLDEAALQRTSVTDLGDIATMLNLPEDQTLYPSETVSIRPHTMPDGDAEILLLGDSFANIYSLADMGWGADAGLAEALAATIRRPVDTIIRNDAGAHATREMLATELARGRNRLAGKKLVIWEFSARELSVGDWKLIDLTLGTAPETPPPADGGPEQTVEVTGTVAEVSNRPEKGAVYADFVMKLFVTNLVTTSGAPYHEREGVVRVFGMRKRKILSIATIQPGARVTLDIRPWGDVQKRYGSFKAGTLDDIMLEIDKPLYWGAPVDKTNKGRR